MMYERGNAAKQWILEDIHRRIGDSSTHILDLGCGSGRIWKTFLEAHPAVTIVGMDTDARAIAEGKKMYAESSRIDLRVADAQRPLDETFDIVVAMSAIEHVVDRPAFLRTVWGALRPGGNAYLNYDVGHFRSRDFKERLMVPVSQVLARLGIEGPYMKRVDDHVFRSQAEALGFRMSAIMKHNLFPLKGFMRNASDDALLEWFAFEEKMRSYFSPEQLDRVMWSTTLVVEKP